MYLFIKEPESWVEHKVQHKNHKTNAESVPLGLMATRQ